MLAGTLTTLVLALSGADATTQPQLSAAQIMEKNFFVSKLKSLRAESDMVLINDKGQKRQRRSSNVLKLQPNGVDTKFLVKFSSPNDIRGTSFLQIEHSEGEDDLWIYLPALSKSRRLVANNKKDSFVGSDFSYGDILLPRFNLFQHTLVRSETVDGHDCHVVESVPANEAMKVNSGYSKKYTWVRKDNFLETKVEYYDVSGRLFKTQLIGGHTMVEPDTQRWFAKSREMTNHQTGHKTVLTFDRLEPGYSAADELFTMRYLERE